MDPFQVTTTADTVNANDGVVSLREAITAANATAGLNTITFNIPGTGVQTIAPATALPAITENVVIDGYSQPGASANTLAVGSNAVLQIEINATGRANGLVISGTGGGSTIRGLVINRASGEGILVNSGGNVIEGNFIGVDAGGSLDLGNNFGGIKIATGAGNLIGGTTPAARNVISGDNDGNVIIGGAGTPTGTIIRGNYIGTDAAGTTAVHAQAFQNAPGIKIILGNGTIIGGADADDGTVDGVVGARNVISGNSIGVFIQQSSTLIDGVTVAGNFIGVTATGLSTLGNFGDGISAFNAIQTINLVIGGTAVGAGNVISGNAGNGIQGGGLGMLVQGNRFGTDLTGTRDLGNGSAGVYIALGGSGTPNFQVTVGGSTAAERNIISGNTGDGVLVTGLESGSVAVRGNFIGTMADGLTALANDGNGVSMNRPTLVGGPGAGQGNVIAFNGGRGVTIDSSQLVVGSRISGNSIFSNGNLGIDLNGDGVTANDLGDADGGSNAQQNFPVITSVAPAGGNTEIRGTFNSTANTAFTLEFFSSVARDPSGFGEGQTRLGTLNVTTDGSGNTPFTFLGAPGLSGFFTATATNITLSNTSEFSAVFDSLAFTVTTTLDVVNPNDGVTSLREAITAANATAGLNTITFNIPGAGVKTIAPTSALPQITDAVVIDGYSQPGATPNTLAFGDNARLLVEISGAGAGANVNGFTFAGSGSGSTLTGLVINRFSGNGVFLDASSNNTFTGNFIGTDPTGFIDLGNGGAGIATQFFFGSTNVVVGGTTPAARNIVSGNAGSGVELNGGGGGRVQGNFIGLAADGTTLLGNTGSGIVAGSFTSGTLIGGDDAADGATDGLVSARNYTAGNGGAGVFLGGSGFGGAIVQGNYIGTDVTGTLARPNHSGIDTNIAQNSTVGGVTPGSGNLISGNSLQGIGIGNTSGMIIKGNRIGTQADGVTALGNGTEGINFLANPTNNQIGGTAAGEGNIIAFNGGDGVEVFQGTGNPIRGNSIYANGGLGIDLNADGVTPNDALDADSGPNGLQNFPVLTSAVRNAGVTNISTTLNSVANTSFAIDFYASTAADGSGFGEGQTYLGSSNGTTDANGMLTVNFGTATPVALGSFITATATLLSAGNTSEFSAALGAVTNFVWDGSAGDQNWFTAANWTPDGVPGPGDSATLDISSAITLGSNTSVGSFTQSNGFLQGTGTLTVLNNFTWTGGTEQGGGTTAVAPGATFAWSDSTLSGRTLTNAGNATVAGTVITFAGGAQFINSGTLTDTSTGNLLFNNSTPGVNSFLITGTGSFTRSGSGTMTTVLVPLTNDGTVNVTAGTLDIAQTFTHHGTANVAGGGVLSVGAGTSTGDYALGAASAELRINGTGYLLDNGTDVTGPGFVRVLGGSRLNLGDAASDVINISNLRYEATFSGAGLNGPGTLNITGLFDWSGGSHAGSGGAGLTRLQPGASLNVTNASGGPQPTLDGRTLEVAAGATVTVLGALNLANAASIKNSGLFELTNGSVASSDTPVDTFDNLTGGIVRVNSGNGSSQISAERFNNAGTLDVLGGTLDVRGGSAAGTFNVASGARLILASGAASAYTLNGNVALGGGGRYSIGAGALDIAGTATVPAGTSFDFGNNSSSLIGAGTLLVNGTLNWAQGSMAGAGVTTVGVGGTLNFSADSAMLSQRTLNLNGTTAIVSLGGTFTLANGAVINNGGLFDIPAGVNIVKGAGTAAFNNLAGATVRKSTDVNTQTFGAGVLFTNAGVIDLPMGTIAFDGGFVQTGGSTVLRGGAITTATGLTFNGGALNGVGMITGNVSNVGAIVQPGGVGATGILTVSGAYSQASGGTLTTEIGGATAGTRYDQLKVTGAVSLAGTVNAPVINGFTPPPSSTFSVLTYGSRSGSFTTVNSATGLTPSYSASAFSLSSAGASPFAPLPTNTPETPGVAMQANSAGILSGTVLRAFDSQFIDNAQPLPFASGVLRSFVVDRDPTAGVALDFVYQLVNTSTPPPDFTTEFFRIKTIGGFGDSTVTASVGNTNAFSGLIAAPGSGFNAASYTQGSTLKPAATADRDVGSQGSVGFDFPIQPPTPSIDDPRNVGQGESSTFIVVRTNATSYGTVQIAVSGAATGFATTLAPVAQAGRFVVTTALDTVDGFDNVVSLREAIDSANGNPGTDTITFAIPGAGVRTIMVTSALPVITDPIVIDGYTQPGATVNTLANGTNALLQVELNGAGAGAGVDGLSIMTGGSTVRGLAINRFSGAGILIEGGGGGNHIEGNFIGTDVLGSLDRGNLGSGIVLTGSSSNVIGGSTLAAKNLISGNDVQGITVEGALSTGNLMQGNLIGTNAAGTGAISNTREGVFIFGGASGNSIGGTAPGARNIISGNGFDAVNIQGTTTTGNLVQGNYIGTNAAGTAALPNQGFGITLSGPANIIGGTSAGAGNVISGNTDSGVAIFSFEGSDGSRNIIQGNKIGTNAAGGVAIANNGDGISIETANNVIGGSAAGAGNTIAFNLGAGISVSNPATSGPTTGNAIRGNLIFLNAGLGIDLGPGGVTANDLGDADTGANNLQNFPVLTSGAQSGTGAVTVSGTLNSTASGTFTVEFFASPAADPSGFGEGAIFLGSTTVTTNGAGNGGFTFTPATPAPVRSVITATATDAAGNTSEFSAALAVTTSFVWDAGGGSDTSWFTPANWSPDGVPGAGDTAILNINAQITLPTSTSVATFVQSTGTFTSPANATLTVLNNFNWSGGAQTGAGTTLVPSGATFNYAPAGNITPLSQRLLELDGTSAVSGAFGGGLALSSGAIINNRGLFDIQNGTDFSGSGTFHNFATLRKSGNTNSFGTGVAFVNAGTVQALGGALNFSGGYTQSAGATLLSGGTVSFGGTALFSAGTLSGAGSIIGNINNAGASVQPGGSGATGSITTDGDYTQGAGGSLDIEIRGASPGQFDVFAPGGNAALGGTLNESFLNGFNPAPGAQFVVLTAAQRSGNFATVNGPLTARYFPQSVTLVAFVAPNPLLVNTTADVVDSEDDFTSLREALTFANANPGLDTISFNIPGTGVQRIAPLNALPAITDAVNIDGYTQPGASANTLATGDNARLLIELNGSAAPVSGLKLTAGGSTIRGLVINGFGTSGIEINGGAGGNVIEGNFIGVNAAGTAAIGNGHSGIDLLNSPNNRIGGTTPAARNVISGNGGTGIELLGSQSLGNTVVGNFVGVDSTGVSALANNGDGILLSDAHNNVIGAPGGANIVSGNRGDGIALTGTGATGNLVQTNFVGVSQPGTGGAVAIPNTGAGIALLDGASGNDIGGVSIANIVAGNTGDGIFLRGADNNVIRGNRIGHTVNTPDSVPNGGAGVHVIDGTGNRIGSPALSELNSILTNRGPGILVEGSSAIVTTRGNIIADNGGLGIDLRVATDPASGVTPNDALDADSGPNMLLNRPTLTAAQRTPGTQRRLRLHRTRHLQWRSRRDRHDRLVCRWQPRLVRFWRRPVPDSQLSGDHGRCGHGHLQPGLQHRSEQCARNPARAISEQHRDPREPDQRTDIRVFRSARDGCLGEHDRQYHARRDRS